MFELYFEYFCFADLSDLILSRDAVAKALYGRLFSWLVERVNLIICRAEREKTTSLAVLDIFGFEVRPKCYHLLITFPVLNLKNPWEKKRRKHIV